jgi:hypothetical protein
MTNYYLIALQPGGLADWIATFHNLDACMRVAANTAFSCVDWDMLVSFNQ